LFVLIIHDILPICPIQYFKFAHSTGLYIEFVLSKYFYYQITALSLLGGKRLKILYTEQCEELEQMHYGGITAMGHNGKTIPGNKNMQCDYLCSLMFYFNHISSRSFKTISAFKDL